MDICETLKTKKYLFKFLGKAIKKYGYWEVLKNIRKIIKSYSTLVTIACLYGYSESLLIFLVLDDTQRLARFNLAEIMAMTNAISKSEAFPYAPTLHKNFANRTLG